VSFDRNHLFSKFVLNRFFLAGGHMRRRSHSTNTINGEVATTRRRESAALFEEDIAAAFACHREATARERFLMLTEDEEITLNIAGLEDIFRKRKHKQNGTGGSGNDKAKKVRGKWHIKRQ
jgi:hypothetical protein